MTVLALANMTAALVDAMRDADVPNHAIHKFLDRFDRMNEAVLFGVPAAIMADVITIVRNAVPNNDWAERPHALPLRTRTLA